MKYVLVNHKVEDYDKWKLVYDEDGSTRKAGGSKSAFLFHNAEDPNQLVVLTQWEDLESAKKFSESEDLQITMQKAGVKGRPDIYYLEQIETTPY